MEYFPFFVAQLFLYSIRVHWGAFAFVMVDFISSREYHSILLLYVPLEVYGLQIEFFCCRARYHITRADFFQMHTRVQCHFDYLHKYLPCSSIVYLNSVQAQSIEGSSTLSASLNWILNESKKSEGACCSNTNPNPLTPLTSSKHFLFMKKIITLNSHLLISTPWQILFESPRSSPNGLKNSRAY